MRQSQYFRIFFCPNDLLVIFILVFGVTCILITSYPRMRYKIKTTTSKRHCFCKYWFCQPVLSEIVQILTLIIGFTRDCMTLIFFFTLHKLRKNYFISRHFFELHQFSKFLYILRLEENISRQFNFTDGSFINLIYACQFQTDERKCIWQCFVLISKKQIAEHIFYKCNHKNSNIHNIHYVIESSQRAAHTKHVFHGVFLLATLEVFFRKNFSCN